MLIIAVTNHSHRVGKTGIAMCLAQCLNLMGKHVLLVDLTGYISAYGMEKNDISPDLFDVYMGKTQLPQIIIPSQYYHLAPLRIENQHKISNIARCNNFWSYVLSVALREQTKYDLRNMYDYVIIDSSRDTCTTESAIIAADTILIPTNYGFDQGVEFTLRDAQWLNPHARTAVCANMVDRRSERYFRPESCKHYDKLLSTKIAHSGFMSRIRTGQPLSNYKMLCNNMMTLTSEIIELK